MRRWVMKISELIKELKASQEKDGDLDIYVSCYCGNESSDLYSTKTEPLSILLPSVVKVFMIRVD